MNRDAKPSVDPEGELFLGIASIIFGVGVLFGFVIGALYVYSQYVP